MSNVIELTNVSKTYRNRSAIKNISLTLPLGKIIGIVGENGSGKSNAIEAYCGTCAYQRAGMVTVNGETANRRICKLVSYLSDHDSVYSISR